MLKFKAANHSCYSKINRQLIGKQKKYFRQSYLNTEYLTVETFFDLSLTPGPIRGRQQRPERRQRPEWWQRREFTM